MTKSRKDIHQNELSWLNLPRDLLLFPEEKTEEVSITSVGSEKDAIEVMKKLSQTCKAFHSFFKPELKKSHAKKILDHVLKGTKTDKEKIIEAVQKHMLNYFSSKQPHMVMQWV